MPDRALFVIWVVAWSSCAAPPEARQQPAGAPTADAASEVYDPSDPTRIDSRAGFALGYTDWEPSGFLLEVRQHVTAKIDASRLVSADIGFGENHAVPNIGNRFGITDGHFGFLGMWDSDRAPGAAWKGFGTSLELWTPGSVTGTDGSAALGFGALAGFGIGGALALYLRPLVMSRWEKDFDRHLGASAGGEVTLTWKPGFLWKDAFFAAKPGAQYGVSRSLDDLSDAYLELTVGGAITDQYWWEVRGLSTFERDLDRATVGRDTGLATDWSLHIVLTMFF